MENINLRQEEVTKRIQMEIGNLIVQLTMKNVEIEELKAENLLTQATIRTSRHYPYSTPGIRAGEGPPMAIRSSGSGSSQSSAFSQPTLLPTLDDPRLGNLFNQIQQVTPTSLPSLDSIVQEGMNSPLMSQIISGALTRAAPNEALARQGVTDAARAAGGLRGTAYGQSVARNEGNILDQRGILTSDIIAKTLQQLISGRLTEQQNSFLPARTLTDLLQAGRPLSGQTSSQQSTSNWGQSGSGADNYMNDWLSQYRAMGNQPQYGPGTAQTGVNSQPGSNISAPAQTAQNPFGGYGFNPGGLPQLQVVAHPMVITVGQPIKVGIRTLPRPNMANLLAALSMDLGHQQLQECQGRDHGLAIHSSRITLLTSLLPVMIILTLIGSRQNLCLG